MIDGVFALAALNSYRTREAPTPANTSTNSLPLAEKNGTPAYPEQAFASMVFPVPGGPERRAPLGILAPKSLYFCEFFKKSTNSIISSLASFSPATSLNLVYRLICGLNGLELVTPGITD
jgi:hypothetical protein